MGQGASDTRAFLMQARSALGHPLPPDQHPAPSSLRPLPPGLHPGLHPVAPSHPSPTLPPLIRLHSHEALCLHPVALPSPACVSVAPTRRRDTHAQRPIARARAQVLEMAKEVFKESTLAHFPPPADPAALVAAAAEVGPTVPAAPVGLTLPAESEAPVAEEGDAPAAAEGKAPAAEEEEAPVPAAEAADGGGTAATGLCSVQAPDTAPSSDPGTGTDVEGLGLDLPGREAVAVGGAGAAGEHLRPVDGGDGTVATAAGDLISRAGVVEALAVSGTDEQPAGLDSCH